MKTTSLLSAIIAGLFSTALSAADIDMVYRINDPKGFGGQITSSSKTELVVTQKVGNKEEHFTANEIGRVEYAGEPATLGLARSNEKSGHYEEALAGYQEALSAADAGNQNLKGEIEFLIARTLASLAQSDGSKLPTALEKLNSFVNTYREHYRFFPAQLLLAETALRAKDDVAADAAFNRLQQAPWPDYQMTGKNGVGRTLLSQNKVAEAKAVFDEVAATDAQTPAAKVSQMEAMLGQAECLVRSNQVNQAIDVLQKVVDGATADDTRLLSQTYLQLGNAYAVDGQHMKDAVLAYLHVDVIPTLAAQSDLHAEALYHLAKLWPAIGQPGRGADASARLQQEYPESEWAKRLAQGS